jgi:hypothetical protein
MSYNHSCYKINTPSVSVGVLQEFGSPLPCFLCIEAWLHSSSLPGLFSVTFDLPICLLFLKSPTECWCHHVSLLGQLTPL